MTTIRDVARAAGVSIATVSRVARQPDLVAKKTREKVQEAIDRLGYVANPAAASLRTQRTRKIIVTVPDIANPFFSKVFQGIEQVALENDYAVLLGNTAQDPAIEDRYAAMLVQREADGLIYLGRRMPQPVRRLVEDMGVSAPIVGACEFDPASGVSGVRIDNEAAAFDAMETLYNLGHVDIAVITGPLESPLSGARLAGVKRAAQSRGLAQRLTVSTGEFSAAAGRELAMNLVANAVPTAIFCFSDEQAFGAMSALRRVGYDCPDHVSVTGFDDVEMALLVSPPLTTVSQPMHTIGITAAKLLFEILSGKQSSVQTVVLPHKVIVRESIAAPREASVALPGPKS